jgi:Ca2+-binding RTX toxin-like protein
MVANWETLYGSPWGSLSYFQSQMTGKTLTKGATNDTINGTGGHDLIRAGSGNDTVGPGNGNDWVDAGPGHDKVKAGGGHDFVQGNNGDDQLWGESGNDWLDGGGGHDKLYGGTGDDLISAWTGNDLVDGGNGNDVLDGGGGSDTLYGGAGNDQLYAGTSGIDFLYGGGGTNEFHGWGSFLAPGGRYDSGTANTIQYHVQGKQDVVWDNGIAADTDYLYYYGKGEAEVHWFGGAEHTVYDETYELPPFHSFGTTDKVVLKDVYVQGNQIDNFQEFKQMLSDGRIGYAFDSQDSGKVDQGYFPPDGTSTVWNWDVGNIFLDFGPAADGTARTLSFLQTSLSGTDGVDSFEASDWLFA